MFHLKQKKHMFDYTLLIYKAYSKICKLLYKYVSITMVTLYFLRHSTTSMVPLEEPFLYLSILMYVCMLHFLSLHKILVYRIPFNLTLHTI